MSHKVHPYAHRLGILRDWQSRWFARPTGAGRARRGEYQQNLKADVLIREFLEKKLRASFVKSIEIERGRGTMRIIIKTSRPGMIIGRQGEGSTRLRGEVMAMFGRIKVDAPRDVRLDIEEVKSPESHAQIAAMMIAESLEKRLPFKRVMKQTIEKVMANKGVQGVRVTLSGRLGGGEMGRTETLKKGRLPLQTLRADIDFAREKAYLSYGVIGVKVWIYRGDIFEEKKPKAAK